MSWKYVIMQIGNREVPVIFPEGLVHSLMAERMRDYFALVVIEAMPDGLATSAKILEVAKSFAPVSAGRVDLEIEACSGESETLGLKARPHDAKFLRTYNYHHGILVEDKVDG